MNLKLPGIHPAAAAAEHRPTAGRPTAPAAPVPGADRLTLSEAAQALLAEDTAAADAHAIQQRLDAIKVKPALQRTPAEAAFVSRHDARLQDIQAKTRTGGPEALTADELGYLQRAGGFVNTMSTLSSEEQALYDELVAGGNPLAAQGLRHVALARSGLGDRQVSLPNGQTFDPNTTALTGDSVTQLYKFMFVDPSGESDRAFNALAAVLQQQAHG